MRHGEDDRGGKKTTHNSGRKMGLADDLPNFPPTSADARYSMLFSALITVLASVYEYVITADIEFGPKEGRRRRYFDPRVIILQLKGSWELIVVALFMSRAELPAEHPYKALACGYAVAYAAERFAFGMYHLIASTIACIGLKMSPMTVLTVAAVQAADPLICTAMFCSLASIAASLSTELPLWGAAKIATRALVWAMIGASCPIGTVGGVVSALLLWRSKRRMPKNLKTN
jgi:hypothetical protein